MKKKNTWYKLLWKIDLPEATLYVRGRYKVHDKQSMFNRNEKIEDYITLDLSEMQVGEYGPSATFEELCIDMSRFILKYETELVSKVREHYKS